MLTHIARHEYSILFAVVFAEAIGLPVPAALALIAAGGAAAKDPFHLGSVLLTAFSAMLAGDTLLFLLGRQTGWWLLGVLCKISLNPESCILQSAQSFHRRGRIMLVFAKFVPGINTLAPPLAGSMNMRLGQFLQLDLAGAALYTLVYCGVGVVFSDSLAALTHGYKEVGHLMMWIFGFLVAAYFAYHLIRLVRAGTLSYVPRVSAAEIARRLYSGLPHDMAIFDVRSHGYYSKRASRVKGSLRLEPNLLPQRIEALPKDKEIIIYCSCQGEATSIRVARILLQHGCRASVIKGGLRAWKRGGFPLETVPADDVVLMPTF